MDNLNLEDFRKSDKLMPLVAMAEMCGIDLEPALWSLEMAEKTKAEQLNIEILALTQIERDEFIRLLAKSLTSVELTEIYENLEFPEKMQFAKGQACLLYTSPSPRDLSTSRMPSSA